MIKFHHIIFILFISMGFMLAEKAAVKGTISVSGTPIKDIDVTLKKVPARTVYKNTTTDGKGNFEFQDVPEGDFQIETSYFPINGPESVVTGKLSYFDDPLDEALVKVFNEDMQVIATLLTDEKGRFSFTNLDAAEVKLIISGIGGTGSSGM